jgi:glycosyltransferase involved in cell wall biosynthesis
VTSVRQLVIGIDARAAADEPAGRGRYVRELIRGLARLGHPHRFLLYASREWREELGSRFEWRLVGWPEPLWHLRVAFAASRECDVLLSTNSYLTAWFTWTPTVLVVFDMVAFVPAAAAQNRAARIERATLRFAARRANAIVTISAATRDELIARHPPVAGKTTAIPLAADDAFAPAGDGDQMVLRRYGIETPYLLALGTLEPRKNLPRLIEAFASLTPEERGDRRLVLVGASGWDTAETLDAIGRHGELVQRLGHVPDTDLPALYRRADLFCYPSLYEGFGLPVLEAMRSKTAVLTSNRSSLPEVAGDTALFVDPSDTGQIADVLADALGDEHRRSALAAKGLERSRRFSWDTTAEQTIALLERAAATRGEMSGP